MIRNENGVRANRLDDLRPQRAVAAPRFDGHPIALGNAAPRGQQRMNFDAWLRIMIHERTDPPRLLTGKKLTYDPAGREDDRIVGIDLFGRGREARHVEPRLAVGEIKSPFALSDRVPGILFEKPRRAGMLFSRTRPENPVLSLDFFIRDAGVIGHTP